MIVSENMLSGLFGGDKRGEGEDLTELKCSKYTMDFPDDIPFVPCNCPVCGGFLKWDDKGKPTCKKCGADLFIIPERDEETGEELEQGKICPISLKRRV